MQDALPDLKVPDELAGWQIQGGLVTRGTRRLLQSLFDTYDRSKVFYREVEDRVDEIADQLHEPAEDETVAVLVSDRHDNIGMDEVVRAVADEAGATVVLDAGDDTSTGETWEQFSLDSLDKAFEGYDAKVAVSGNHDNGTFVNRYLASLGWTHLDGKPVEPFADVRITGVDDPRSSGLGTWRDETDLTFAEVKERIADDVCEPNEDGNRIATLLVHDANLGAIALARGCTDLVLAGHLHVQIGPNRVVGENGEVGYTYTNGTTGGAAYAMAMGSKLRRDAMFTLVTYRDGRPVGIQPVTVGTRGNLSAADYIPLTSTRDRRAGSVGLGLDPSGLGSMPEGREVQLVLVGVPLREGRHGPVEPVTRAEVARDGHWVTGSRVCACQRPATQVRIAAHPCGLHRLDVGRPLAVPQLPDVVVPGDAVQPVGPDPAQQDVARRLHQALTLDDPLSVAGVLVLAQERLQHGGLGLLDLQEQRVVDTVADHQDDPRAGPNAADTHHLPGGLHEVEALDEVLVVAVETAAVGTQHLVQDVPDPLVLLAGQAAAPAGPAWVGRRRTSAARRPPRPAC